jgi:hypothetical protein
MLKLRFTVIGHMVLGAMIWRSHLSSTHYVARHTIHEITLQQTITLQCSVYAFRLEDLNSWVLRMFSTIAARPASTRRIWWVWVAI